MPGDAIHAGLTPAIALSPVGATPARRSATQAERRAGESLAEARELERAGCVAEAVAGYERTIDDAARTDDVRVLAEALRRLAVLHFHRSDGTDRERARALIGRSYEVATAVGESHLAAEALNVQAGFEFEGGAIAEARDIFHRALELGGDRLDLRARIEQNLGILSNIQGDVDGALSHYQRSLDASRSLGDDRGCAIAYHNLGMLSADRGLWDDAEHYYHRSLEIAEAVGDVHLRGLCLLNRAEVHLARERYDAARHSAEVALGIFDQLGARLDKADAYKVIGVVYRDTGRHALAESRLRGAIELAVQTGSVLSEAETSRELALLYQAMGRNQDALTLLNAAHRLFGRLDARVDLVDVSAKRATLEQTFLAIVRDWGQSIESADSYTHGHCERVATYAVEVARALGLDETQQTTIRLGAYLHDLGKVRVPHEVLNKTGPLTREEFAVMQMHPVWGLELLATVEFPWDLKPIIRWHHEKYDGTGYPDRLRGDEIPIAAQIICIVDVFDALTTTRSYRPAMSRGAALAQLRESRSWWRTDVYDAFMRTVGRSESDGEASAA